MSEECENSAANRSLPMTMSEDRAARPSRRPGRRASSRTVMPSALAFSAAAISVVGCGRRPAGRAHRRTGCAAARRGRSGSCCRG